MFPAIISSIYFRQVERILQINELQTVTKEVVETARENLVSGLA